MATDSPPKMRVSLWRDFRPERTLAYKAAGTLDAKFFQRDDQLQEEVFALHVRAGVINGVADDDLRATITACLTEDFAPALPPSSGLPQTRKVLRRRAAGHEVRQGK